jgi:hypothetical protein
MSKIALALLLSLNAPLAVFAASDKAVGEFTATAVVESQQGTRSLGLTLVVTNPMSAAEAQQYKRILEEGGQQALLNAIRGASRGRFRLGAVEYPMNFVAAEQTRDGYHYIVVTERPVRIEEVNEGSPSLDHPFTILVFDVPEFGSGQGQLFTQAVIEVDPDGHPQAYQYEHRRGTLKDIRRTK